MAPGDQRDSSLEAWRAQGRWDTLRNSRARSSELSFFSRSASISSILKRHDCKIHNFMYFPKKEKKCHQLNYDIVLSYHLLQTHLHFMDVKMCRGKKCDLESMKYGN